MRLLGCICKTCKNCDNCCCTTRLVASFFSSLLAWWWAPSFPFRLCYHWHVIFFAFYLAIYLLRIEFRTCDCLTLPKFQTLPEVTCVYGIDGKCSSTITPQHLSDLQDAYNSARRQGAYPLLIPPVQDLAKEIQGDFIGSHEFQ